MKSSLQLWLGWCVVALALGACTEDSPNDGGGAEADADAGANNGANNGADQGVDLTPDEDLAADLSQDQGGDPDLPPDLPEEDMGAPACAPPELAPAPGLVRTDTGYVQGQDGEVWSWRGIPYVAPPVGALRWEPPQEEICWMEPLQADAFGPKCLQRERDRQGVMATVGDEDCLTLNVWSPVAGQDDAPRPVLVFIHGGGNIVGSASEEVAPGAPLYDGAALAARGDAVVVTFQYRLGALGYLALDALSEESGRGVSGNYGSQDQVAALKWVQRNIAAFGGDPSRVMVFGESAGSVNTCVMVASPLARGLFHAALMQSGTCPSLPLADAEAQGEEALALTGCGDAEDALACLRALPARELVESIPVTIGIGAALEGGGGQTYGPVVDGWLLPRAPWAMIEDGEHNQVPVVIGSNADEMASTGINPLTIQTEAQYEQTLRALVGDVAAAQLLAAYPVEDYESPNDAFIQVTTDAIFTCPARTQVRILARGQEAPVYRYFFSRRPETPRNNGRASHGIELVYLFGAYDDIPLYNPAPADVALAGEMMEYWLRFAATGDPNGDGATAWPRFTAAADEHLLLDAPTSSAAGVRTSQCDLWDALLGQ